MSAMHGSHSCFLGRSGKVQCGKGLGTARCLVVCRFDTFLRVILTQHVLTLLLRIVLTLLNHDMFLIFFANGRL